MDANTWMWACVVNLEYKIVETWTYDSKKYSTFTEAQEELARLMKEHYNPTEYVYRVDAQTITGEVTKVAFGMDCVVAVTIRKNAKDEVLYRKSIDECYIHHASKKCTRMKPGTETTQNLGFKYIITDTGVPIERKVSVNRIERIKLTLPDDSKLLLTRDEARQLANDIMEILNEVS